MGRYEEARFFASCSLLLLVSAFFAFLFLICVGSLEGALFVASLLAAVSSLGAVEAMDIPGSVSRRHSIDSSLSTHIRTLSRR